MSASHGWAEIDRERKREIIDAIVAGTATRGPVHAELDLTDRCNVACYFCNQMDVRTKEFIGFERVKEIVAELAEGGLKSVRLSGGGDPLFHRDILRILDLLAEHHIVLDNITTNGALLGPEIAARLVRDKCRDVTFSLNAVDAEDYARMMRVKPAIFDRVIENIRHLVTVRGEGSHPFIVVQFLLDRINYAFLPAMYELGRSLGVDRIAINPVMDIPRERIDHDILLRAEERELVRPFLRQILESDREAKKLQLVFPDQSWNTMLEELKREINVVYESSYPTASTFTEANGQCFFAWYTMTIRGNGDLYPCCLLMNPDYEPLGNAREGSIRSHWEGDKFQQLRRDMREVMIQGGEVFFQPNRFPTLKKQCVEKHLCWLKNMYFKGDEEFYRELGTALEGQRRREVRMLGTPRQMIRALETRAHASPRMRSVYESLREMSKPLRIWMKRKLKLNVSGAAVR